MYFKDKLFSKQNISIFHEFHKPPYGGGNQFLLALRSEFETEGYKVLNNKVNKKTKAVLFNSFNFDFDLLRNIKKRNPNIKMVHRVDGPISIYRGEASNEVDKKIWEINHELADVTIFQSHYSQDKHVEMNMNFKNPHVITNASDPSIFNTQDKSNFAKSGKIKLIATSWSNNVNKGLGIYKWLDQNLDFSKYEFTFLGRIEEPLANSTVLDALPSEGVARTLKENDIYITASKNDPCSNGLIEALNCGLPAVFLNSGGHSEIVKKAGEAFSSEADILKTIDKIANNYNHYVKNINIPSISEVAKMYLDLIIK